MNRTTRLSLIAVMLLSTSALGIMGYNAMHPAVTPPSPSHPPPQPIEMPEPAGPKPNPRHQQLQADLERHERHCLQLGKQSTIVVQNQTQIAQRVQGCWTLVKAEREYVTNFPAKTIQ